MSAAWRTTSDLLNQDLSAWERTEGSAGPIGTAVDTTKGALPVSMAQVHTVPYGGLIKYGT